MLKEIWKKHFRKELCIPSVIQVWQPCMAAPDYEQGYFSFVRKKAVVGPIQNSQDQKSKFYSLQVQKFMSEVWLHAIYFAYERNSLMTFHINGPLSLYH